MTLLDDADHQRLSDAIGRAEAGTAGEIVVVVERAAGSYRSLALVFAWLVALALPWPLLWGTRLSAQSIFMAQLLLALGLALAVSFRASWRMALTPRFLKRQKAHEAACREFIARSLTRTKNRTGVLIYVALAERYAEVLADSGICEKLDAGRWREVVRPLVEAMGENRLADGLVAAIDATGDILAASVPAMDAEDELPNKVIVIS